MRSQKFTRTQVDPDYEKTEAGAKKEMKMDGYRVIRLPDSDKVRQALKRELRVLNYKVDQATKDNCEGNPVHPDLPEFAPVYQRDLVRELLFHGFVRTADVHELSLSRFDSIKEDDFWDSVAAVELLIQQNLG